MAKAESYKLTIELDLRNEQALTKLIDQLEVAANAAPKAGKGLSGVNKSLKQTQIQARQTGRGVQNFSYQLQDMIVQISGGVDPLRSMSQQLPQMLINMGALGGVIGVVAAGLPILIQQFTQAEEATESWDDALSGLEASISDLNSFASGIDFDAWNKAWNSAARKVRETELAVLQFRNTAAQGRMRDALQSMTTQIAEESGATAGGKFIEGFYKTINFITASGGGSGDNIAEGIGLREFSESLNVDRVSVENMLTMFEEFNNGTRTIDELKDGMVELSTGLVEARPEFYEITNSLIAQAQAADDLAKSLKQIEAAESSLATGSDLPVNESGSGGSKQKLQEIKLSKDLYDIRKRLLAIEKLRQEQRERRQSLIAQAYPAEQALVDAGILYSEMLEKNIINQERFNELMADSVTQYEDSLKGFSLMEEGIDIFQKSFDTMLDGVLMGTQNIADGFRDLAKVVIAQILKMLAYQAIFSALGGSGGTLANTIGNAFDPAKNADGNAFSNGNVVPFAKGGVVSSPTIFPMAKGGIGLMGEGGSPEAIMPLSRGADGKLGVSGGGVNVTINNLAPGVQVQQRETEQGLTIDIVMKSLTQAISQGGNDLSAAMEGTYSLGRGRAIY